MYIIIAKITGYVQWTQLEVLCEKLELRAKKTSMYSVNHRMWILWQCCRYENDTWVVLTLSVRRVDSVVLVASCLLSSVFCLCRSSAILCNLFNSSWCEESTNPAWRSSNNCKNDKDIVYVSGYGRGEKSPDYIQPYYWFQSKDYSIHHVVLWSLFHGKTLVLGKLVQSLEIRSIAIYGAMFTVKLYRWKTKKNQNFLDTHDREQNMQFILQHIPWAEI